MKYVVTAVVLVAVCVVGWNWYDVRIFLNWVLAVRQLSIVRLYTAYDVLGPQYRAVYPPLPIFIFIVTNAFTSHILEALSTFATHFVAIARCYLARLTLKLPLLVSVLVTGYLLKRACGKSAAFYWFVLGVPTLITLGAYQFDPFVALLLLLSLLSLTRYKRYWLSAIFFALAILVKPLVAVFFVPIALYLAKPRKVVSYAAIIAALCFAISAPFLVLEPKSFIENVVGFHMHRPPQYVSFWNIPVLLSARNHRIENVVNLVWLPAYATLISILIWLAFKRAGKVFDEKLLLLTITIVGIATLAFNKVVNPSYTLWIYPLTLMLAFGYGMEWLALRYNVLSVLACIWPGLYVAIPALANKPMYVEEVQRYISARTLLLNSLSPPINKSVEKILHSIDSSPLHRYTVTLYHDLDVVGAALIAIYVTLCIVTIYQLLREARSGRR